MGDARLYNAEMITKVWGTRARISIRSFFPSQGHLQALVGREGRNKPLSHHSFKADLYEQGSTQRDLDDRLKTKSTYWNKPDTKRQMSYVWSMRANIHGTKNAYCIRVKYVLWLTALIDFPTEPWSFCFLLEEIFL